MLWCAGIACYRRINREACHEVNSDNGLDGGRSVRVRAGVEDCADFWGPIDRAGAAVLWRGEYGVGRPGDGGARRLPPRRGRRRAATPGRGRTRLPRPPGPDWGRM